MVGDTGVDGGVDGDVGGEDDDDDDEDEEERPRNFSSARDRARSNSLPALPGCQRGGSAFISSNVLPGCQRGG